MCRRPARERAGQLAAAAEPAERRLARRGHLQRRAEDEEDHGQVEQRGQRAVAVGAQQPREDDGEDDRDEVRAPSWRRRGRSPSPVSGSLGAASAGTGPATAGSAAGSSPSELIRRVTLAEGRALPSGRMRVWRRSLAVAGTVLALLPAAAAAQSAGDEQYSDPFANQSPTPTPAPTQAPATGGAVGAGDPRPGRRARRRATPPRRRRSCRARGGTRACPACWGWC